MSDHNLTVVARNPNKLKKQPSVPGEKQKKNTLSEDWLAVFIASFTIVAVLLTFPLLNRIGFKIPTYKWETPNDLTSTVFSVNNSLLIGVIGLLFLALATISIGALDGNRTKFAKGFIVVYLLGVISLIIAGNKTINYYGFEYVIFALVIGLLIGNLTTLPDWLKEAARSEFFIKTGLVILGTTVLFKDIIQAGLPGILQAVIVVLTVWFFSMWLSRLLKVDDEFGVILASAVSICGVSAAIAACGVIQGDRKKLSYVTTLVLVVALPMLVLQPWIIKAFNISEIVGGAWLGGTLDTTASVTAAGQLVGPVATKTGVIIKFSQNVLIGVAAFLLALWWAFRAKPDKEKAEKPGVAVIWERFPKFVLGFIAASLVFSFFILPDTTKQVSTFLNGFRVIWFSLAFVAIGLEARFADLVKLDGGRPALVFVSAQLFNVLWTLLWAYLLFGGVLFPVPQIN